MNYQLIYADPPWRYDNVASNGAAGNHYDTMSLTDLMRLPVWSIAAENAVLAMWYTGTHNAEAVKLAEAWGFKVKTMKGFTWVKLNQLAEQHINKALAAGEVQDFYDFMDLLNTQTRMNGGNYTRANSEDLLIAVRGTGLERINASVKQVIHSPLGEHSAKPWEARHRLELLYGDVSRIELFARQEIPNWDTWGNESPVSSIEITTEQFQQQTQQQNIPEIIQAPETNNRVWPAEVHYLFGQVPESSNLSDHLQNKLRHHINRLKMDGMPVDQIIDTAGTLARKMGATA